jgi:hypothetical protein
VFAILDLWDLFWIWLTVTLLLAAYTGGRAVCAGSRSSDAARLRRLEAKVGLLLKHLGLECPPDPAAGGDLSEEAKALAADPARNIDAIALCRKLAGVSLREAKDAVESYMASR